MKTMALMNPIMIMMFSFGSPAGVTLYWVVGGLFGILQQAITNFILKPRIRKTSGRGIQKYHSVSNSS